MGWGGFLDKLLGKLPIANRVEKIKNDIDKLEREKNEILLHKAEVSKANRLVVIDKQLFDLHKRLQNIAHD